MFALVDCNSFYASCERIFRPDLRHKPVVVLSNNDGCVIARSQEAKRLNIPMGAVAHEYEQLFKQHHVAVFSSNFALYGDISKRVMNVLGQFTPNLEVYSVDEAFLDLSHIPEEKLDELAPQIHERIKKYIGIPVSVGIGKTKTLAKVANQIAKKYKQCNNCYSIKEEKREKILKHTQIGDVWGIGWNYAKMLKEHLVHTAFDFTELPVNFVQKKMSVVGKRLQRELQGHSCLALEEVQAKKHIATTRTFARNILNLNDLETAIANHAANSAHKLRLQNSACWQVYVFIKTNSRKPHQAQYRRGVLVSLDAASTSAIPIVNAALKGLRLIYRKGYMYKKAGVVLHGIIPEHSAQQTLFPSYNTEKQQKLMHALDKINHSKGRNKVKLAIQETSAKQKFYRREHLSKQFTTKWSDILEVKAS